VSKNSRKVSWVTVWYPQASYVAECIFHKCEKKSQNVQSFGYFDSFSSVDAKIYDISIYQYLYNDNYGIFAKKVR